MRVFNLRRFSEDSDNTWGVLIENKTPFAVTVEDVWKQNQPFVSCIPTGEYICRRYSSEKYPNVWEITGVPKRDKVLIHWGNTNKDTEGCVLIGEKFGMIDGRSAIIESRSLPNEGFNEFMNRTKDEKEIKLIIEKADFWIA